MTGTFLRVGVPAPINADRVYYEAPPGWKTVHVQGLDCGWLSVIIKKIETPAANQGGE